MSKWLKELLVAGLIVAIVAGFGASVALADGPGELALWRIVVLAVADATGLTPAQVIEAASAGQTLAEIAEANGADVNEVANVAVQQATDAIEQAVASGAITQEQADLMLADLEERVHQVLNGSMPTMAEAGQTLQETGMQIVIQVVAVETGLTEEEIMAALEAGETLLEIIEETEADVEAIISEAMDELTQIVEEAVASGELGQEQADAILSDLEARIERALESTLPVQQQAHNQTREWARLAVQLASEATGLSEEQIMVAMQSGQSLAEIISANGGDPEAVMAQVQEQIRQQIEQAVAEGRLSQEQADAILARMSERIQQAMYGAVARGDGLRSSLMLTGSHIMMEALTELTGQSWNQIAAELWAGRTPLQVAQEYGVTEDALISRATQMASDALNQAVADGLLAPQMSQMILQQLTGQLDALMRQGTMHIEGMQVPGMPGGGAPGMPPIQPPQGPGQGGGMPGGGGGGAGIGPGH